jgi:hypothetical protein
MKQDKRTKEYKEMMKSQLGEANTPDKFKVILAMNDKEYESEADTIQEAIEQIKPEEFKTRAVLRVFNGVKVAEQMFNVFKVKRLFNNLIYRQTMSKFLLVRLK